jgi:hypothetical protein
VIKTVASESASEREVGPADAIVSVVVGVVVRYSTLLVVVRCALLMVLWALVF